MEQTPENPGFQENCPVIRFDKDGETRIVKPVAREYPLTIFFNNRQLVTMLCSPEGLKDLAVGFLSSEGFLNSKEEIKSVTLDSVRGVVRVQTTDDREITPDVLSQRLISSGCGRGAAFYSAADVQNRVVTSRASISVDEVLELASTFQHASPVYQETHGVHSAAICRGSQILVHAEDIGRHNAVDKIFGRCLLEGIRIEDCILITSGRVSSEITHKAAKKGIPILISISAPTTLTVSLAEKMGITLAASVRGGKMDVFSHSWRITKRATGI